MKACIRAIIGLSVAVLMGSFVVAGSSSCTKSDTPSATVKTGGSTSVDKVMLALKQQFETDHPGTKIEYEGNGSGDGITNTRSGLYEIGHSSRELKADEKGVIAFAYAIDGIAMVVHKSNGLDSLTKQQIRDIYTGRIGNWSQVGGKDSPISVITRESGSGTRSGFADVIGLEKKGDPSTSLKVSEEATSTGAVQTKVGANPDAVGYMSFSDVDASKVRVVMVDGVAISAATLLDRSYPLQREFYMLTKEGAVLSPTARAFIDFVKSDAGGRIIESKGLLATKK